jgi:signal transduction histidine kinase
MGEMRRLLGVLRGTDDEATLAPQPGPAQLDALIRQVRSAGLPVEATVEGAAEPLPRGVDLTACCIVQEALTNALRHAGAARAQVAIHHARDQLEIEITNTTHAAPNGSLGGHGLVGMRQRVELFGGELDTGPRPGGGYAVRARLPTSSPHS